MSDNVTAPRETLHEETLAMLAHDERTIRDVLDDGVLDAPEVMSSRRQLELTAYAAACVKRVPELEAEVERLRLEVGMLRLYGNKDCTAMADKVLAAPHTED